jgi:hypothetical protein
MRLIDHVTDVVRADLSTRLRKARQTRQMR